MDKFGLGKFTGRSGTQGYNAPPNEHNALVAKGMPAQSLVVVNATNNALALMNQVAVNRADIPEGYIIADNKYIFTAIHDDSVQRGTIAVGAVQREWPRWSFQQQIMVAPYDIFSNSDGRVYLGSLDVEIDFFSRAKATDQAYDQDLLAKHFFSVYHDQIFAPQQQLVMNYSGFNFRIKVLATRVVDLGGTTEDPSLMVSNIPGIFSKQTSMNFFKPANGVINIKASANKPRSNAIIAPNFNFQDLGIGGLDEQFNIIFRRAFASRIMPPSTVEKLGITHVKGILLFGPPGTGKTLIARQIGKMLNAREPKIVNGPEILNKFVGASEENIRNLFKEAETEFKEKGDDSGLHMIIFDELDAVFKQRGSRGDGTGVGDNVVNQLLAKMDGVDQLNNILVIGMTNRKDLIDSALMRPGRFEVQIEISLPDEKGRRQILGIHTAKLRENNTLDKTVNLDELASLTKNFSGAEIGGLVRSAASFAINRTTRIGKKGNVEFDAKKDVVVNRDDFFHALDDVQAAFGVSEEDLERCVEKGVLNYSKNIGDILTRGRLYVEQVRDSPNTSIVSTLLYGPPGSGKTALAATIALKSEFPLVKLISPRDTVAMNETQKIQYINNMFLDAYKSALNCIVLDEIETLIEWTPIGPRFSNAVAQTIKILLSKAPPPNRRLLIIATTSERSVLNQIGLLSKFTSKIPVPNVTTINELSKSLELVDFLDNESRQSICDKVQAQNGGRVGVGIKHILSHIDTAVKSSTVAGTFAELVNEEISDFSY
ncbi:AAA-domain-containing protein [Nadsonia fulvescens var. elongata DSM 6958]|uniref:Vesicular-fusion protein SEC18 n=1 Tax=Nadsonia fulvescens var. elongata DSM 6958 TaxID=857566 RepID=A0A1E3PGA8_9ASCO|nr:AAA-domain-containing protein [Nadsonia fulvescens var. elongata DSM 6958]